MSPKSGMLSPCVAVHVTKPLGESLEQVLWSGERGDSRLEEEMEVRLFLLLRLLDASREVVVDPCDVTYHF